MRLWDVNKGSLIKRITPGGRNLNEQVDEVKFSLMDVTLHREVVPGELRFGTSAPGHSSENWDEELVLSPA
jgi:hypothetical protein